MNSTIQETVKELREMNQELWVRCTKLCDNSFVLENRIAQLIESNREIERTKDIEIVNLKNQLTTAQLQLEQQKVQMLTAQADEGKMDFEVIQLEAVKFSEQMLALDNKVKQLEQSMKITEDGKIHKITIEDHPIPQSELTFREQEYQNVIQQLQQRVLDLEKENITHKCLAKQLKSNA